LVGSLLAGRADVADHGVHGHGHALADGDFEQHAFEKAFDLQVRFVGLDLEEDVAFRDGVALSLEPFDDGALLHGLPELRENNCLSHSVSKRLNPADANRASFKIPHRAHRRHRVFKQVLFSL
jgi:hypothetical protein